MSRGLLCSTQHGDLMPSVCLTLCRRHDKFQCLTSEVIHMSDLNLRDNVGLIVLLRPKRMAKASEGVVLDGPHLPAIAIANTHLIFNPKRGDIKVRKLQNLSSNSSYFTQAIVCPLGQKAGKVSNESICQSSVRVGIN